MNLTTSFLLALTLSVETAAAPKALEPQAVAVIAAPELSVRLLVKARPTLADRDWLMLEFVNRGKEPIAIDVAHYSIDSVAKGRIDKERLTQSSLTSGDNGYLFPWTRKGKGAPALTLKPGETYRVSEHLSDFGASALGLPPRGGLDVACTMKMFIYTSERKVFQAENIKFTFEWTPPDDAGIKQVQERLKEMLKKPVDELYHHYLVGTLLRTDEIARAVSRAELMDGLKRRNARLEGRFHIAEALVTKHDTKKEVLEFYGERLGAKEYNALDDIHVLGLWSTSYIPAVADFYGPHPSINATALAILHRHRADWLKNKDEVDKLMARIKKQHPILAKDPKQLEGAELTKWARAVPELAMIADRSVIASLRPALEDKRVWWRPDPRAAFSFSPPPLLRVCDTACDAITNILDGKMASPRHFGKSIEADHIADRDALIGRLQKRLAELDKGEK